MHKHYECNTYKFQDRGAEIVYDNVQISIYTKYTVPNINI